MLLRKVAIGVSWLPESLAVAVYVLAFLFIKIVLLIVEFIKGIVNLIKFW